MHNIYLQNLGCEKNTVDGEHILAIVKNKGYSSRHKTSGLSAAPDRLSKNQPWEIIDDQKLDHQWCSTDDPYDKLRKIP